MPVIEHEDAFSPVTPTDPQQGSFQDLDEEDEREPSLLILGTAHVVPLTRAIHHHIFEHDPGAVALELDHQRMRGLLMDPEDRERPGFGYGLVARFQEKIAEDLGGEVGEEMLAAREAAMLLDVPVALVDRPVNETLDRLLDEMGWGERLKVFGSLLVALLPGKRWENELHRALEGDPELVREVEEKFPSVKRVLIDERDAYMAKRAAGLVDEFGRVVLVVGDAHVPGLLEHLEGRVENVETVRVKELRAFAPSSVGFQVEHEAPDEENDAST